MRTCSSSSRGSSSSRPSGSRRDGAGRSLVARALAVALLALAGCGRGDDQARHLVGFSQCNLGEPWRVAMNAEVVERATDFPGLQIVFADAQQDNARQVADVENFLRQQVDLLMISPNEAKPLTPIVRRVFEAGIPVIVLDRAIEGDSYTVFVGADNREIGRQAGEHIAALLNGKGRIVEIRGLPGSPPAIDRSRGMREAIARHPGLQIVHDPVANWLREEAMAQMEMVLAAQPRIDLVYAHNDPMAMGAYLAARAKGRDREMKFIGIDALPGLDGGKQAVADGKLDATFVYPTGGRQAVELADRILRGEQVPRRVVLPTEKVAR
ncbi:MAG TPA: substrate-binding domain-containing protein [Vicinamibacterales bacterium]|nr:substrate-binding domain-containing protein [Vicinamibacterales bacterium]